MNKRELRGMLRQKRRAISPWRRRRAAQELRRNVGRSGVLLRSRRIAFYVATAEEMNLLPLLNHASWLGKTCFVPVVPPRFQHRLGFSRLTALPRWYANRFGIEEHWSPRPVRAWQLDLLFLPLVGFDAEGYRLGMGGGFYDASLAYLMRRKHWRKPLLVGVGYECQKVAHVPREPWDIPLDAVVTEKAWYCHPTQQYRTPTLRGCK